MKKILLTLTILSSLTATNAQTFDTAAMTQHLTTELGDAKVAGELSNLILNDVLTWKAPTVKVSEVKAIVAFAFGNRILPNGNRVPGPMNEALADTVVKLYGETKAHVYAQWEIAEAIGNRIPAADLTAINPDLNADADVVYLSTAGLAQNNIKKVGGDPKTLGKVAVVGFGDHLRRCVLTAQATGMDAAAPEGYTMPLNYDAQSGQPWTRTRLTYLVHDLYARMAMERAMQVTKQGK